MSDVRDQLRIARLPLNTEGRDFICGDMHGCYEFVEQFLQFINFDKTKDRLISAGDLVDRGPDNEKCLLLLNEPWFYAVLGNHETMMVDYAAEDYDGRYWGRNGGQWGEKYFPPSFREDWDPWTPYAGSPHLAEDAKSPLGMEIRKVVYQKVSRLPHLITIDLPEGKRCHVIHAEFYPSAEITDQHLETVDGIKQWAWASSVDGRAIVWGRYVFDAFYGVDLSSPRVIRKIKRTLALKKYDIPRPGLSTIYSGHTPVMYPVKFTELINLDTMAYGSYPDGYSHVIPRNRGLTFTNPVTGEFWLSNPNGVRENQLLDVNTFGDEDEEGS